MTLDDFLQVFERATDGKKPFPFQTRMALHGDRVPSLINIPTGCGKTEAVVLAWLWRRRFAPPEVREQTPRRLVYCLPMRVLVEQTRDRIREMLKFLGLLANGPGDDSPVEPSLSSMIPGPRIAVSTLMGGEDEDGWDRWPERDAILVGTQDMLLSRVLNRGYAMSRFRWPVHFGLLNNDCLWVFDEVQLMGNGLATSTQMQAFRRLLGTVREVQTTWMSATLDPAWLETVDFDKTYDCPGNIVVLEQDDRNEENLRKRLVAKKPIVRADFEADEQGKREAEFVLNLHRPYTLSLVIVNTVKRAMAIFDSLRKKKTQARLVLLHSRYRPPDREAQLKQLLDRPPPEGTIAVCTQVIEAGVDISATLLVTDIAPWSSMVQRFGRCNRRGDQDGAQIVWVPVREDAPYDTDSLRVSRERLDKLIDAGPTNLPIFKDRFWFRHVIRRNDILDLFDTTPDLAGLHLDVSRFIREADDHDVHVFWRDVPPDQDPSPDEPLPSRQELCPVPLGEIRGWKGAYWCWDPLRRKWDTPRVLVPGVMVMLRCEEGGYDPKRGWTGKVGRTEPINMTIVESTTSQHTVGEWMLLKDHTERVVAILNQVLELLPFLAPWSHYLRVAARWHDAGKAHPVFQNALNAPPNKQVIWAKSPERRIHYERPGFRHELASALAMLQNGLPDLAVYLAAAHHGKVRVSIRSLPHEKLPDDPNRRFARGVWDGESLPAIDLGREVMVPETSLSLSYMEMGENPLTGPSWLDRMLRLRDDPALGPFRLALLEAVLRVADWRASDESVPQRDDEDET